jgi:hypothetical protein
MGPTNVIVINVRHHEEVDVPATVVSWRDG